MGTRQQQQQLPSDERWCFMAEWLDPLAGITRKFSFRYFPHDRSVEMLELRTQRLFLRRSPCQGLAPSQVALGARLLVLGRELSLTAYGDAHTQSRLSLTRQRSLLLVKPHAVRWLGEVVEELSQRGLQVTRVRMVQLTRERAADFISVEQQQQQQQEEQQEEQEQGAAPTLDELLVQLISGPAVALELQGEGAVGVVASALGPSDPQQARATSPASLRARYGVSGALNVGHAPRDVTTAQRELAWFFPDEAGAGGDAGGGGGRLGNTARLGEVTCCIVKPHALATGCLGQILRSITQAGFEISAMATFVLDRVSAEEFYEVYKGVVPDYGAMVQELCSGVCLALEVRGDDAVRRFRELCGPTDPEVGRVLRPASLRAVLGTNKILNAVHCTDLVEDGELEVEYFFRILDN
uniref:Nucleoside diphosphate kinase 7 n=1 Tax=Petromyzon marinus TaxID=7757 RepID=A0AAJ7UHU4_PETMA|nr:nucleoside diphosphate kinase 7 [Petromyzon marinus]